MNAPKAMVVKGWMIDNYRVIGLYMSGHCSGPGWGNKGYYHAVYEVLEHRGSQPKEYRTRIYNSPARRDYGEGYEALVSLYTEYIGKSIGGLK